MIVRMSYDQPSMVSRNPFAEMEWMSRRMNRATRAMLGRPDWRFSAPRAFPAINITEDKDKYYVSAELPGIKAEEIDLKVEGRNLMISGERLIKCDAENARYHRRESESGKFSRVVGLPGDISPDHVDAKMVNGVLTVAIGKPEASKPKKITVN